jgi:hypothetical protein
VRYGVCVRPCVSGVLESSSPEALLSARVQTPLACGVVCLWRGVLAWRVHFCFFVQVPKWL